MKKLIGLFALVAITLFTACSTTNGGGVIDVTLSQILAINTTLGLNINANGKTWVVTEATFGNEPAPTGMYQNFRMTYFSNGVYKIVNPDNVPTFNRDNVTNEGTWAETETPRGILVDKLVKVTDVTSVQTNTRVTFEFDVTIPGKAKTRYRFVMRPL